MHVSCTVVLLQPSLAAGPHATASEVLCHVDTRRNGGNGFITISTVFDAHATLTLLPHPHPLLHCVWQTGSGKTFTIYGAPNEPGLTPRGVGELFRIINRDSGKYRSVPSSARVHAHPTT